MPRAWPGNAIWKTKARFAMEAETGVVFDDGRR